MFRRRDYGTDFFTNRQAGRKLPRLNPRRRLIDSSVGPLEGENLL
jgi:hypothetical protein